MSEKQVLRNILFGSFTWILPIGLAFYATPKIVKGLGHQDYGIYALVMGFISYSFTLNLGRVMTKYIAEYKDDFAKINEVYSISLLIHLIVATFGMLLTGLSARYLVENVFLISQSEAVFSFVLAGITIFFLMFSSFYTSIIQGLQRFDVFAKVQTFYAIISTVGNLLLIWYNCNVNQLLIWNLITIFLMTVFNFIATRKLLPELKFKFNFKTETLKEVMKFNFGMVIFQVFGNLLLLIERTWIVRNFGESSLTFYVVTMSLTVYIYTFIGAFTMYFFPLISQLQSDRPKMKELYLRTTKFVILIILFLVLNILIERTNFLSLWISPEFAENGSDLLLIHTVTYSVLAASIISWQIIEAKGATTYNGFLSFLWLLISVVSMFFLADNFKSVGIAGSRLIGVLPFIVSVFYVEKWIFGEIFVGFWIKLFAKLSIIFALTYFADKFVFSLFTYSWLVVIAVGIIGFMIFISSALILNFFDESEKQYVLRFAKQL
jgi:O-antigen/teichoic acid export membrane protein